MTNENSNNQKGRKPKYLTVEVFEVFRRRFDHFVDNEFFHLRIEARLAIIISSAILGILLVKL